MRTKLKVPFTGNYTLTNIAIVPYRIEYEPKSVGVYTANILFADQEIPTSPYKVNVEPNIDVSKIKVSGLEPSKLCLSVYGLIGLNIVIGQLLNSLVLRVIINRFYCFKMGFIVM